MSLHLTPLRNAYTSSSDSVMLSDEDRYDKRSVNRFSWYERNGSEGMSKWRVSLACILE